MQNQAEEQPTTTQEKDPNAIDLTIVYGVNKTVSIAPSGTIMALKLEALDAFGIDRAEADQYILRAKVKGDKDEQLDEAQTVEHYHLHQGQKVTLAAGTPFGSGR